MPRVPALKIPEILPHPEAIRSWGDHQHSYEPEFWEFQYELYRYLGRVSQEKLVERYPAIIRNMHALVSDDRHVIPIQSFLSSWYWYRKEHQTRLEFAMRGLDLPVQPPAGVLNNQALDAPVRPRSPNAGDVLFRYSKRGYLEEMVHRGRIRIGPASFYRKLELGEARADEERAKVSFMPGEYSRITSHDGREIPFIGDIRRSVSAPNYYVLCLSCDWDSALFTDFQADACAVIRGTDAFAERLEAASKLQLDDWYFHHNPVEYFDPHEMPENQYFDAAMCKDFRFTYQREYRFLWIHLQDREPTGFRYLDLGPLRDIVELYSQ